MLESPQNTSEICQLQHDMSTLTWIFNSFSIMEALKIFFFVFRNIT